MCKNDNKKVCVKQKMRAEIWLFSANFVKESDHMEKRNSGW
jgi:hypothetical protein